MPSEGEKAEQEWRYETARLSILQSLKASVEILKAYYERLGFYTVSLLMAPIEILLEALVFIFISLSLQPAMATYVSKYGGNYLRFVLAGEIVLPYTSILLRLPHFIERKFWAHTFTVKYMFTKSSLASYILSEILNRLIFAAASSTSIIAIAWHFGVHLTSSIIARISLLSCLAFISTIGLGLIGGSLFILAESRWSNPVDTAVGILYRLFSGLYIPLEALPSWLRTLSVLVPHTMIIEAVRFTVLMDAGLLDPCVLKNIATVVIYAALTSLIGVVLMRKALKRAFREGIFMRWT